MRRADINSFYSNVNLLGRLYARVRYASAPLERVAELVPAGVRSVVELGCGLGVFANVLKVLRPELAVTGVDVDRDRVAAARKTVDGRAGLTFVYGDAAAYVDGHGPFDAVVIVDMLYLLPPDDQDRLITHVARSLRPNGYLIIKEMTDRPAWKRRWCALQEWFAVKVFHFTTGPGVFLRSGDEYLRAMEGAGLTVEQLEMHRGYPHPHFAWRGKKR
jgi:SAM-dependent methyltransferase